MRLLLERNYEPDIIRYLLMFLQSLLFLPEKQEKIYFNEIQKLTKMDELSYVTPHTRYMATWFYKTNFGYDPETQLKEKAEKLAEEKAEKLAEEKAEKQQSDTVERMFKKGNLSIEDISIFLDIKKELVEEILKKKSLL